MASHWSECPVEIPHSRVPIIQGSFDGLKFQSALPRDVRTTNLFLARIRPRAHAVYAYALPRSEDSYADRRFPARGNCSQRLRLRFRSLRSVLIIIRNLEHDATRRSHPNCTACAKRICINAPSWTRIPRSSHRTPRCASTLCIPSNTISNIFPTIRLDFFGFFFIHGKWRPSRVFAACVD